jgi:hypothetical protein
MEGVLSGEADVRTAHYGSDSRVEFLADSENLGCSWKGHGDTGGPYDLWLILLQLAPDLGWGRL